MTTPEAQAEVEAKIEDGFEWAIVEIFGHRRHVGRVREEERFGAKMLRVDEPEVQPDSTVKWASHYYGGSSIFSFTPTDEPTVMRYANRVYSTPAIPYSAPEPTTVECEACGATIGSGILCDSCAEVAERGPAPSGEGGKTDD